MPAFIIVITQWSDTTAALTLDLLILTASRTGEAFGDRWDEIDLAAGLWTIPPLRMKAGREHRIRLAARALEIVNRLAGGPNPSPVYICRPTNRKPLSNMAMLALLRRMNRADITAHGLSSAFSTIGEQR